MDKRKVYIMGLVTLFIFPIPAFAALYFFSDFSLADFFDINRFQVSHLIIGTLIGIAYAYFANFLMETKVFKSIPLRVDELVKSMNLTKIDSIFLAICAGVGEELLFRMGIQHYLGITITSILFVALHGYLNPKKWKQSLYGVVVLPLSFSLGLSHAYYSIWLAIAIHFAYDLTLFLRFKD